jgi:hypothetical protein
MRLPVYSVDGIANSAGCVMHDAAGTRSIPDMGVDVPGIPGKTEAESQEG